jgi:hypothetical protein
MSSVLQPWVMELPLRYQGTLLAAVRSCDVTPKRPYSEIGRRLTAYLRWTFMVPADEREVDEAGAFMQSQPPFGWKASDLGHFPEHWYSHLMHAFEVVGYECPDRVTRQECQRIYETLVYNLHLNPETREQMNARLTEDRIASGNIVS